MRKQVHRVWAYLTILLSLVAASLAWDRYRIEKALREVFHYSYRITLEAEDTGEVLPAGIAGPPTSSSDLFWQSQGTVAHSDGSVTISGTAYTPRTYRFTSQGYGTKSLTLTHESPFSDHIRFKLNRVPITEKKSGQQDSGGDP